MSNRAGKEYWLNIAAVIVLILIAAAIIFVITPDYIIKRPSDPVMKPDGTKWRIACYEGGEYPEYTETLKYLVLELEANGWISGVSGKRLDSFINSSEIWDYLGTDVKSDYLEFPPELFWSPGWDVSARTSDSGEALSEMKAGKADLLLVLGTVAGIDIGIADHDVPVIIMASTDPVGSGLISSMDDSGKDNVHTIVDPSQHRRQIEIFHEATGFNTIGTGYDDSSAESISYSRIDLLREIGEKRGFEITFCRTVDDNPDLSLCEASVVEAYTYLAPRVDAVYITRQNGVNPGNAQKFLKPLIEYNVTTLSMEPGLVREGVLISIVSGEPRLYASAYAESAGMILNGAKPRSLTMKHQFPFRIYLNMETAEKIGFEVPEGLLNSADLIYCTPDMAGEVSGC